MFELLPQKDSFLVYKVIHGGRWVSNRSYAVFIPVDRLDLTEIHLPAGEYEYYANVRDNKSRKFITDTIFPIESLFPKVGIGQEMKTTGTKTISIRMPGKTTQTEIEVMRVVPTDHATKVQGDGVYIMNSYYQALMNVYPNAKIFSTGERLYPVFFTDDNCHSGAPHNLVGMIIGIKYWE